MDTNAQWPQGIGVVKQPQVVDQNKKPRPQKEQAVNCPRCSSTNTKFCYYNNYSLSQPRYFCKSCRRYWTEGGTLRNVPVGGGSRKNKRSSSALPAAVTSSKKLVLGSPPNLSPPDPKIHDGPQDLNLAYNPSSYNGFPDFAPFPFGSGSKFNLDQSQSQNPNSTPHNPSYFPVMELLKSGFGSRGSQLSSFMPNIGPPPVPDNVNSVFPSGNSFPVHAFKSSLSFSLDHGVDHNQNGYENLQDHANSSRILFPFEELKPVSTNEQFDHQQDRGQPESNGSYWNGMLAEGSW